MSDKIVRLIFFFTCKIIVYSFLDSVKLTSVESKACGFGGLSSNVRTSRNAISDSTFPLTSRAFI